MLYWIMLLESLQFVSVQKIDLLQLCIRANTFSFFCNNQQMSKEELKRKAVKLAEKYSYEINSKEDFVQEISLVQFSSVFFYFCSAT